MTYTDTLESLKQSLINYFSATNVIQTATNTVTPTTGNMMIFSYLISEIFNDVKKISAFRAKNIRDAQGKSLLDQYAMTDDERSLFETFCENTVVDLYPIFSGFCKNIAPGYLYDEGEIIPQYDNATAYTIGKLVYCNGTIYKCILDSTGNLPTDDPIYWTKQPAYVDTKGKILIIVDYDPEYKQTVIQLIESKIKPCIIDNVLAEWFRICGLNDLYSEYLSLYLTKKEDIRGLLLNLKVFRKKFSEFQI